MAVKPAFFREPRVVFLSDYIEGTNGTVFYPDQQGQTPLRFFVVMEEEHPTPREPNACRRCSPYGPASRLCNRYHEYHFTTVTPRRR